MEFQHPPTKEELAALCRQTESNDPRSIYYKRVLVRPRLFIGRVVLWVLATLAFATLVAVLFYLWLGTVLLPILFGVGVILAVAALRAKRIAIFLVMVYQRLAPERTRRRCRYEPSCSQYMIASLEKYGFLKGARRGWARWRSCKPPNGGIDLP